MVAINLWHGLLCVAALFPKHIGAANEEIDITIIVEEEKDFRRPIWNIAHMANALFQIDYYLDMGANSVEFDVTFSAAGTAQFTFHGIPCDCFRSCLYFENFVTYMDYLRRLTTPGDSMFRKELVLLFLDMKVSGLSREAQEKAGADVALKLLDYYWKRGTSNASAYILISLPSINHLGVVMGMIKTLKSQNASEYEEKIGFDFSGNEDLNTIRNGLRSVGISNRIWQGDGITNCLPRGTRRLLDSLNRRDLPGVNYVDKVYWWTVDKMSTMRRTLSLGVDGLITNYPQRLAAVMNENEFSKQLRLATLADNPWGKHARRTASIINIWPESRGRNTNASDLLESEEMLYNS